MEGGFKGFAQPQTINTRRLNVATTWNNPSDTFTAIKLDAKNVASSSATKLLDLQVDAVSKLSVTKAGALTFIGGQTNGAFTVPSLGLTGGSLIVNNETGGQLKPGIFSTGNGTSLATYGNGALNTADGCTWVNALYCAQGMIIGRSAVLSGINGGLGTNINAQIVFGNGATTLDVTVGRIGANILGIGNSTNAQTVRIYNTFTQGGALESLALGWASNVCSISTLSSGGGVTRAMTLGAGSSVGTDIAGVDTTIAGGRGTGTGAGGSILLQTAPAGSTGAVANALVTRVTLDSTGNLGVGVSPTAKLHLAAGTTAASTAPLKLTSGSLLTTAEAGAIEFLTDDFYATITTGAARKKLLLQDASVSVAAITQSAGSVLSIASGSNQRAGNAVLVGGTVTVANTTVTANTVVMLTRKTSGGTIGTAITYTVIAATSFTITSDNPLDTSTFSYLLIEVP